MRITITAFCWSVVVASSALAATISDVTYVDDANAFDTTPEPDGQELATFTIGATTYNAIAASPSNLGSMGDIVAATNDSPGSATAALTGLSVTDAVLNLSTVDFDLGITVTDDSVPLFFGELGIDTQYGAGDEVRLHPIIGGVADTSFAINITSASYSYNSTGPSSVGDEWSTDENDNDLHTELAGFVLSDFQNGLGASPASIDGFRIVDDIGSASADIVLAGYGEPVPEPSTFALLGLGVAALGLGCWGRTRRR